MLESYGNSSFIIWEFNTEYYVYKICRDIYDKKYKQSTIQNSLCLEIIKTDCTKCDITELCDILKKHLSLPNKI